MSGNRAYHGDKVAADYINEKSSYVIDELVDILSVLECTEMTDAEKIKQVHSCTEAALHNALKIIATTINATWDIDDSHLIANCGDAQVGWEAIQYRYTGQMTKIRNGYQLKRNKECLEALLEEKSVVNAEIICRKSFCKQAKDLLQKPRGESRTALNLLLDSFALPDLCFCRLSYLLNEVNLNTINWDEFVVRSTANLKYLEVQLDENGDEYIKKIQDYEKHRRIAKRNGEQFEEFTGEQQPRWEVIGI